MPTVPLIAVINLLGLAEYLRLYVVLLYGSCKSCFYLLSRSDE